MKQFSCNQSGNQPDCELQQKRLWRAGDISARQVRKRQPHGTGKSAPAAEEQSPQHNKGVSEVDSRPFRSNGNIYPQKLKSDICQCCNQCTLGQH